MWNFFRKKKDESGDEADETRETTPLDLENTANETVEAESAAELQPEPDVKTNVAPPVVQVDDAPQPEEAKAGFFQRLKDRLSKTKDSFIAQIRQTIRLHGKVDEELLEELEEIMIRSDVGPETSIRLVDQLRKGATARGDGNGSALIEQLKEGMLEILGREEKPLRFEGTRPFVVLVVGVNGTGKTTTIGKLAQRLRLEGRQVTLVAADTFRAAAIEQLEIWAKKTDSKIVRQEFGGDPGAVCYDALVNASPENSDVILIDTAGRLHTKSNLMEELKKIERVIKKVMPDAPHETILVLDATTGQNAISQAKIFSEAVPVTGLVMTKLDGTAKGGILIALADKFKIPIRMIGIGESAEDYRDFSPSDFVNALFEEDAQS